MCAYAVLAHVSFSYATAARYSVRHAFGTETVVLNQKEYRHAWASLGESIFQQGSTGSVRLGDASAAPGEEVVFDVVLWRYRPIAGVSGVGEVLPQEFSLKQNFPNPFNPTTVISFQMPVASTVRLVVFDLLGCEVAVLVDGVLLPGEYLARFDATGLSSGIYF